MKQEQELKSIEAAVFSIENVLKLHFSDLVALKIQSAKQKTLISRLHILSAKREKNRIALFNFGGN